MPYPGFPTDLQQPLTPLLTACKGQSKIEETIYENRIPYEKVKDLMKMLQLDIFATDVYTLAHKENSKTGLDFTNNMIITN